MDEIKPALNTIYQPRESILFNKCVGKKDVWCTTKENNFFATWHGHTKDEQPWEESDWNWSLTGIFHSRNEAIEKSVLDATKFEVKNANR